MSAPTEPFDSEVATPTVHRDVGRGRGVYISTYGCQMNENDSERMLALLEMVNFVPVQSSEKAGLIIINSCSVREKPVHKVHSEVGRYRQMKQENPDLLIGVAGCVAQQEKDRLLRDIPMLDFVIGPDAIDSLPDFIARVESEGRRLTSARFEHDKTYSVETLIRRPGVTAFVNITKGCDNFCTFCVVPFTRGRERSRAYSELAKDVNALVQRGVREVTLLGQNVNSYRSECGVGFAGLLRGLAEETGIERIRYTTSHPKDFDDELIEVHRSHREKICDYVHLPVQSGSAEVLERMNRRYTPSEYLVTVEKLRARVPGVALSTDIIVGFPGETEGQFEETLSLLKTVGYENVYAFKYSPRPFTKAARFQDQVDEHVKQQRLERLLAMQKEINFELARMYEDTSLKVLVEGRVSESEKWKGRTTQNKIVYFEGLSSDDLSGKTIEVRIEKASPAILQGRPVELQ